VSDDDATEFLVVVNDEAAYSIWEAGRDLPAGWGKEGFRGDRKACLEHIDREWIDVTLVHTDGETG
jgi:MbtH protein